MSEFGDKVFERCRCENCLRRLHGDGKCEVVFQIKVRLNESVTLILLDFEWQSTEVQKYGSPLLKEPNTQS